MLAVLFLFASTGIAGKAGHATIESKLDQRVDRFYGRDGRAEARQDAAAHKPIKILAGTANGVVPGWSTPGIVGCSPVSGKGTFQVIAEIGFAEGQPSLFSPSRMASAYEFAIAYNKAVLRYRAGALKRLCPNVRAE